MMGLKKILVSEISKYTKRWSGASLSHKHMKDKNRLLEQEWQVQHQASITWNVHAQPVK